MKKLLLFYGLALGLFSLATGAVLGLGRTLPARASDSQQVSLAAPAAPRPAAAVSSAWSVLRENGGNPLSRLLLQFMVILLATRAMGALFLRIGQPAVVGEVAAGILLGPSLLGWLWPGAFHFMFPKDSLEVLRLLSQIGVCVFLFVVGLEVDLTHLRHKAQTAVVISHAGIMAPFLFGLTFSLLLYPGYAAPGTSFGPFALFMGIAMSITAFPVLARILAERGLSRTAVGSMALTCAAVDDATAWTLLALVVALVRAAGAGSTVLSLALTGGYVALMLWGLRPRLGRWLGVERSEGEPGRGAIAAVLFLMSASALTTEVIGLHALFGSFLAGVVMPQRKAFRDYLTVRLEHFSSIFLLPLFFAFSGLRTQVGLLDDATSWLVCAGVMIVATAGKLGGVTLAARWRGLAWPEAFSLGALMNTRGLVELIALNMGYDLGILSPRIFAMLVLMALVTTFMTGPLLLLAERLRRAPGQTAFARPLAAAAFQVDDLAR
jgi:Kef-type K+ transport system membrane component KefB